MKDIFLKDDEQLDDLQLNNLFIIQKKQGFKFGIDAVLLSSIVKSNKNCKIMDLCTGTGVIPILLSEKVEFSKIYGVEIQREFAEMAQRSVEYNNLSEYIKIINCDVKYLREREDIIANSFDIITVNPPYFKAGGAILNEKNTKSISRHEIMLNLEELFDTMRYLLKNKGIVYMVHRADRLVDIMNVARIKKIEPKELTMVQPYDRKSANLVLMKFIKGANRELKIKDPIVVYDADRKFSAKIDEIYGRKSQERG